MGNELNIGLAILPIVIIVLLLLVVFTNKGGRKMSGNNEQERLDHALNTGKAAVYHKVSPKEGKEMLDSDKNILLLDVRTPEEFAQGRINGSVLMPDYDVPLLAPERIKDKDKKIIVYCRSGARSNGAARKLVSMGYTNVYDMGGIMSWSYGVVK